MAASRAVLLGPCAYPGYRHEGSLRPLEQAAEGLSPVPTCTADLVREFTVGPRRGACGIPLLHQHERIVVTEQEAAHEPAAGAKCGGVAVLTCNGGGGGGQGPPRPPRHTR